MALLGFTGCSDDSTDPKADPPKLGGVSPTSVAPDGRMSDLEKQVARRLDREVAHHALDLDFLRCPPWDGSLPATLTCEGWFNSVPGTVEVTLHRGHDGEVAFDASLSGGVVATAMLVADLESRGYADVDCGQVSAYPTDVGSAITCAVTSKGARRYLVATIVDEHGGVTLSDL